MSMDDDELYPCVGICRVDEDSGLCTGCGRPMQEPAPREEAGSPARSAEASDGPQHG